jgi:2,4-diketo-3-deoxy-L-fuconate hydrolase
MRVANADGQAVLVVDDGIVDIATASGGALPTDAQLLYERWDDVRALADRVQGPEQPFELSALQAPVPRPRQVFAIGMNYAAHAAEAGVEAPEFPPTFTKFPTCLTGPDAAVALPSAFVDWEVELVAVIGSAAYEVEVGKGTCRSGSCRRDRLLRSSAWASRSRASAPPARG